jgi:hypothetical protein
VLRLEHQNPQLARARATLQGHTDDIIDGADLIRLAERELMTPLDQEARRLVSSAAQRVSLVTAVSPRALIDVLFVFAASLRLIRQLARLYGGRPGALGMIALMRHVIAHVAITGGMAASDGLIEQVLGHGIAAKLSQRLGDGVLNGLLTARLGLAAIDVTRPLPSPRCRGPRSSISPRISCASATATNKLSGAIFGVKQGKVTPAFLRFGNSQLMRFVIRSGSTSRLEGSMSKPQDNRLDDLFRPALDQIIDLRDRSAKRKEIQLRQSYLRGPSGRRSWSDVTPMPISSSEPVARSSSCALSWPRHL